VTHYRNQWSPRVQVHPIRLRLKTVVAWSFTVGFLFGMTTTVTLYALMRG